MHAFPDWEWEQWYIVEHPMSSPTWIGEPNIITTPGIGTTPTWPNVNPGSGIYIGDDPNKWKITGGGSYSTGVLGIKDNDF